jgi:hypothetical protein
MLKTLAVANYRSINKLVVQRSGPMVRARDGRA